MEGDVGGVEGEGEEVEWGRGGGGVLCCWLGFSGDGGGLCLLGFFGDGAGDGVGEEVVLKEVDGGGGGGVGGLDAGAGAGEGDVEEGDGVGGGGMGGGDGGGLGGGFVEVEWHCWRGGNGVLGWWWGNLM